MALKEMELETKEGLGNGQQIAQDPWTEERVPPLLIYLNEASEDFKQGSDVHSEGD